jgi:hypothetical protein
MEGMFARRQAFEIQADFYALATKFRECTP